jgi:hypothetical protein
MNNYNLRYNFIDITTPDYLTDHHSKRSVEGERSEHNREGEQLIAVAYYSGMNYRELAQLVASEVLGGSGYSGLWAILPSNDEDAAVLLEQCVIDETTSVNLDLYDSYQDLNVYGYFSWDIL